jgi:hypothetical protein
MNTSDVKFRIVAGVCSLESFKRQFVESLVETICDGVLDNWCSISGTLLPFTRNLIIRKVYVHTPDFTHIMFIDDDMYGFSGEHIRRLAEADKDIISGLMVYRSKPHKIVSSFINGEENLREDIKQGNLREAHFTGAAFTLIKREVFDQTLEETPQGPIWFTTDRMPRESFEVECEEFIKEKVKCCNEYSLDSENYRVEDFDKDVKSILQDAIVFGQQSHIGSIMLGEDIAFCKKARQLGFNVWVDCGCVVNHLGERGYNVNDSGGIV